MYAIIRSGGKQYRVQAGDTLRLEKVDKNPGSEFDVTDVLLVGGDSPFVGTPTVKNAKVTLVVTRQDRGDKVLILKKKRRKGYRRMQGHRQYFTEVFVKSITAPDGNTVGSDKKPAVVDPEKIAARKAQAAQSVQEKLAASGEKKKAKKAAPKATKKKAVKKKAPKKKAGGKKAAAKKTTTKKKAK